MQSLIVRNLSINLVRRYHASPTTDLTLKIKKELISKKYSEALENFLKSGRIISNSVLDIQQVRLRKLDRITSKKARKQKRLAETNVESLPTVLNQLCDFRVSLEDDEDDAKEFEMELRRRYQKTVFPYSRYLKVENTSIDEHGEPDEEVSEKRVIPKNWLTDYELYDEAEDEMDLYGTPDRFHPISNVPCHGCGALLHCKDSSIPGYLPSEIYKDLSPIEMQTVICQRCHFLKRYNTAISVSVKPQDYINIISSIKDQNAMMIVLVDLLDFPCSMFKNLADIIGKTRPVFIVGNKVDLIPKDSPGYLNHLKECLHQEALKMGFNEKFINHVGLISAKTGYGIEELITKLHSLWKYRGNVYVVGSTNVGKSSLFNILLRSDYCKSDASSLIKRATACPWPGTTLRLLKFPILRPSDYRIYLRTQRLLSERQMKHAENALRNQKAQDDMSIRNATLIGHIGRTFVGKEVLTDPISHSHDSGFAGKLQVFNENEQLYAQSKWCFDTPGVMDGNQILPLLTTDEIIKVLPRRMIRPRMYYVKSGMSLFIAGLARLDIVDVPKLTRLIVYASIQLPISICNTVDAEEFYNSFLGSDLLKVPIDLSQERLANWPPLEAPYTEIAVEGIDKHLTVCDFVMSSAGWIGVNLPNNTVGTFRPWTPGKKGIYVRNPSILPNGFTLRGRRLRDSPAYTLGDAFTFKKKQKKFEN